MKIGREEAMTFLEEYIEKGYQKAEAEIQQAKTEIIQEKRSTLLQFAELLGLLPKTGKVLQSAKTLAELKKVEAGMVAAFKKKQTC